MKDKSEIKTVWVNSEVGEQMMFAVPMESENEPVVDMYADIRMDALKADVVDLFDNLDAEIKDLYFKDELLNTLIRLNDSYRDGVLKIFDKY